MQGFVTRGGPPFYNTKKGAPRGYKVQNFSRVCAPGPPVFAGPARPARPARPASPANHRERRNPACLARPARLVRPTRFARYKAGKENSGSPGPLGRPGPPGPPRSPANKRERRNPACPARPKKRSDFRFVEAKRKIWGARWGGPYRSRKNVRNPPNSTTFVEGAVARFFSEISLLEAIEQIF